MCVQNFYTDFFVTLYQKGVCGRPPFKCTYLQKVGVCVTGEVDFAVFLFEFGAIRCYIMILSAWFNLAAHPQWDDIGEQPATFAREQLVERRSTRGPLSYRYFALSDDGTVVHRFVEENDSDTGLLFIGQDCGADRRRSSQSRQERRVNVERAPRRNVEKCLGQDGPVIRDDEEGMSARFQMCEERFVELCGFQHLDAMLLRPRADGRGSGGETTALRSIGRRHDECGRRAAPVELFEGNPCDCTRAKKCVHVAHARSGSSSFISVALSV